jgi:hypothetical protein
MKTLCVYYCNSIDRYLNVFEDYIVEFKDGLLQIGKIKRDVEYDFDIIAVYRNWDFYKIEEE